MATRLLPCLLGALALHAAALGWLAHGGMRPGGNGGLAPSAAGRETAAQGGAVMQVALRVAEPARPGPAGAAGTLAAAQTHPAAAAPDAAVPPAPAWPAAPIPPIPPTSAQAGELLDPPRQDTAAAQAAAAHAADSVDTAAARSGPDAEGYVPRPLLTTAPTPLQDIALPFPLDFRQRGRFAGILTLYIEADGRVSRVVVEGASLPPALARVAQQAFSGARFSPGQVAQRIVKSRIRVEVVFEQPPAA